MASVFTLVLVLRQSSENRSIVVGSDDKNGDMIVVGELMIMVLMILMMRLLLAMMRMMVMMFGGTDYDNCSDGTDGKVSDEADVDSIFFS